MGQLQLQFLREQSLALAQPQSENSRDILQRCYNSKIVINKQCQERFNYIENILKNQELFEIIKNQHYWPESYEEFKEEAFFNDLPEKLASEVLKKVYSSVTQDNTQQNDDEQQRIIQHYEADQVYDESQESTRFQHNQLPNHKSGFKYSQINGGSILGNEVLNVQESIITESNIIPSISHHSNLIAKSQIQEYDDTLFQQRILFNKKDIDHILNKSFTDGQCLIPKRTLQLQYDKIAFKLENQMNINKNLTKENEKWVEKNQNLKKQSSLFKNEIQTLKQEKQLNQELTKENQELKKIIEDLNNQILKPKD